jgi:superfamily II DNA or RNA helicase
MAHRVLFVHETSFRLGEANPAPDTVHRALIVDDARNARIVEDVSAALARGRNCLVLTRWVAHVTILASLLAARGHRALALRGGMSAADRVVAARRLARGSAGEGLLAVGTLAFVGDGFDAPALDTLFLAGPISFDGLLVQHAGRVTRVAPGKDVAEIHDYHDPAIPILAAALRSRMPGYRALGFRPA